MSTSHADLLDTTRAAFAMALLGTLDLLDSGTKACDQLARCETRLANLLETAPTSCEPVEQIRDLAVLRASLAAAVRQLETELGEG